MRLSVIVTLALVFGCMVTAQSETEDGYTIDAALSALVDLRDDTAQSLYDLETQWRLTSGALSEQVQALKDIITQKDAECAQDEADRDQTQADLNEVQAYAEWLEKQITDTTNNLNDLLQRRCDTNKIFIEHLRREKVALSLLEFIKTAIQNKDNFDFIQMKSFNRKFHTFVQAYSKKDYETIIALQQDLVDSSQYDVDVDFSTKDRTDEEIGKGHIDNNKGDLQLEDFTNGKRRNWSIYKAELLELLNDLQAKIGANIKQAIDDEIAASIALANYRNNALRDIRKYNKDLDEAKKNIIALTSKFNDLSAAATQCRSDEDGLKAQLNNLEADYNEKETTYNTKHADLQSQIDVFNEVIEIYKNSIFSEGEDFKERTDDYLDNQNFDDDATYTDREIPNIDFLNDQDQQAAAGGY